MSGLQGMSKNKGKAAPSKDRGLKRRRISPGNSLSATNTAEFTESEEPLPSSSASYINTFEETDIVFKTEPMDDEGADGSPPADQKEVIAGLEEDMIEELKIEYEDDPLMMYNESKEMPAPRLLSRSQIEILLSFMDQHRDLASGALSKHQGPESKREVRKLWDELAALINNVDDAGTKKSGDAWRRYWAEKKYSVRKKATEIQRALGSGRPARLRLNDEELTILDLMGRLAAKTTPSVMVPFQDDDSSLSSPPDPLAKPEKMQSHKTLPTQSKMKTEISNHQQYANENESNYEGHHSSNGPPQWAIDIEERRVCASERLAATLEQLTSAVVGMHDSLRTLTDEVSTIREVLVSRPS